MDNGFPVARPQLPTTDEILPYLREIDQNRYYSNFGPMVHKFEERIADRLGLLGTHVTTTANATAGLTAALAATSRNSTSNINDGPAFCILPSWTFVATLHAVLSAGLEPYLIDVDERSWQITPDAVRDVLGRIPGQPVAVVPVAPFGRPVDVGAWDEFADETGLTVVIDAAAAFDKQTAGRCPTVVSLHATKVMAAGEGGYVVSTDSESIREIRKCTNFGFLGERMAKSRAINGKMSEYHAGIACAALDVWNATRQELGNIALGYLDAFGHRDDCYLFVGHPDDYVSSTVILVHDLPLSENIDAELESLGIGTRRWWGGGVHKQVDFRRFSRDPLPVTASLASRSIGLPCYPGLQRADIETIKDRVLSLLDG